MSRGPGRGLGKAGAGNALEETGLENPPMSGTGSVRAGPNGSARPEHKRNKKTPPRPAGVKWLKPRNKKHLFPNGRGRGRRGGRMGTPRVPAGSDARQTPGTLQKCRPDGRWSRTRSPGVPHPATLSASQNETCRRGFSDTWHPKACVPVRNGHRTRTRGGHLHGERERQLTLDRRGFERHGSNLDTDYFQGLRSPRSAAGGTRGCGTADARG